MNTTLVHKITNYLARQPIDKAWLFGSYSREEETQKSDIDGQVLENVGLQDEPYFKYFDYVDFMTRAAG